MVFIAMLVNADLRSRWVTVERWSIAFNLLCIPLKFECSEH